MRNLKMILYWNVGMVLVYKLPVHAVIQSGWINTKLFHFYTWFSAGSLSKIWKMYNKVMKSLTLCVIHYSYNHVCYNHTVYYNYTIKLDSYLVNFWWVRHCHSWNVFTVDLSTSCHVGRYLCLCIRESDNTAHVVKILYLYKNNMPHLTH